MKQEFTQELKNATEETLRGIHTALPGKVDSFDPDKCMADVIPYGKFRKPDGGFMDFPKISGVPVLVMQGSGQTATVAFPIKPGDECLLLFSEQTLDIWETGASSNTDLRFDLSNAIALIGLFAKPNAAVKEACAGNALIIEKDGSRIHVKGGEIGIRDSAGQSITMGGGSTTMTVNNLNIQSSGNVSIAAGGNVTVTGATINLN